MQVMAMLCDHAQTSSDNKLFISGANINRLWVASAEPPLGINAGLAVLVEIGWQETNQAHKLVIELVFDDPAGARQVELPVPPAPDATPEERGNIIAEFNAGRGPDMVPGEATLMPIAMNFPGLQLPAPGSYFFRVSIDGTEQARVPFRLQVVNQFAGMPR